eukprot:1225216-Amphidinium_carterae.1
MGGRDETSKGSQRLARSAIHECYMCLPPPCKVRYFGCYHIQTKFPNPDFACNLYLNGTYACLPNFPNFASGLGEVREELRT